MKSDQSWMSVTIPTQVCFYYSKILPMSGTGGTTDFFREPLLEVCPEVKQKLQMLIFAIRSLISLGVFCSTVGQYRRDP